MSRLIQQPVASVKLTNVATVRLNVKGKRFEIACYKNKVLDYRAGLETDLSEVLQAKRIFTNVAKGQFAAASDLKEAFGNLSDEEIAIHILKNGKSLQVSEAERNQLYESTLTQIATWIASNCIHPGTGKPYTVSQIKQALTTTTTSTTTTASKGKKKKQQSVSFSVQPHKPIKQQYLQALRYLQASNILEIQRAAMELQWQYDRDDEEDAVVLDILKQCDIRNATKTQENVQVFTIDPAKYRPLNQLVEQRLPNSRLEILRQHVVLTTTTRAAAAAAFTDEAATPAYDTNSHDDDDDNEPHVPQQHKTQKDDDNDDDELVGFGPTRKSRQKNKRKEQKKTERRMQRVEDYDDDETDATNEKEAEQPPPTVVEPTTPDDSAETKKKHWTCNTCVGKHNSFASEPEYRKHFRSEWHRFNQKLKVKQSPAVSYEEFKEFDVDSLFDTLE